MKHPTHRADAPQTTCVATHITQAKKSEINQQMSQAIKEVLAVFDEGEIFVAGGESDHLQSYLIKQCKKSHAMGGNLEQTIKAAIDHLSTEGYLVFQEENPKHTAHMIVEQLTEKFSEILAQKNEVPLHR